MYARSVVVRINSSVGFAPTRGEVLDVAGQYDGAGPKGLNMGGSVVRPGPY